MHKILYIGNSFHIIDAICLIKEIKIIAVFCEKEKIKGLYADGNDKKDNMIPVNGKKDLQEKISEYYDRVSFAVMYDFGIIVPYKILSHLPIYNFHPGDLRSNRGSSPINWSVLLNEKETRMTLYQITEEIDLGEVISEHECRIYEHDVPATLRFRLEGEIPSMLLELICGFGKTKNGNFVGKGIYRDRITETDYTISDVDDKDIVMAKIRSQYEYEGAIYIVNGNKFYIRSFEQFKSIQNKGGIL